MTLTPEQEVALVDLLKHMPRQVEQPAMVQSDWLKIWFGISRQDLSNALKMLFNAKDELEGRLRGWITQNPLDAAVELLATASWAFYKAEKDVNPRIKTYIDAFYYISTCASVGYADIFAVTQTGKAIAAFVMIIGPPLAGKSLDLPAQPEPPESV